KVVSPGIVALDTMMAGAPALIAAANGRMATCCRVDHGRVCAEPLSVLPLEPPRPGKCFNTGMTLPDRKPFMNAMPSRVTTAVLPLKERQPSGFVALGGALVPSTSTTGARSMLTPLADMLRATPVTAYWICALDQFAPIHAGHGRDPARLAMRCTPPPSSSVMTSRPMWPGTCV